MKNLSNLSGSQLLLARILNAAPAAKIAKELNRRAAIGIVESKPNAALMIAA